MCVEFLQVQYTDYNEIGHNVTYVIIVTSVHLNLSTLFVVDHFLIAKVSPEWKLNPAFRALKIVSLSPEWRCPFNRGNKYKDYVNIF